MLMVLFNPLPGLKTQHGSEVLGKDSCMEILIDGQHRFTCEVFDFNPTLNGLKIFFHEPTLMVELGEDFVRIAVCIHQGGYKNLGFT
jgi:hypothetical protein